MPILDSLDDASREIVEFFRVTMFCVHFDVALLRAELRRAPWA